MELIDIDLYAAKLSKRKSKASVELKSAYEHTMMFFINQKNPDLYTIHLPLGRMNRTDKMILEKAFGVHNMKIVSYHNEMFVNTGREKRTITLKVFALAPTDELTLNQTKIAIS